MRQTLTTDLTVMNYRNTFHLYKLHKSLQLNIIQEILYPAVYFYQTFTMCLETIMQSDDDIWSKFFPKDYQNH